MGSRDRASLVAGVNDPAVKFERLVDDQDRVNNRLADLWRHRGASVLRTADVVGERARAAERIQQWYRQLVKMYGTFGPLIFARKNGQIADFGRLSFLSGSRSARFITVADTVSPYYLSHFLEKYWKLPRPDVLISVTGSAATLQLTAQLQRVFDRGLAAAAAMTNAWIFTGGTDSGVMKLVGEAMHKYGLDVPLVGIAPWGGLACRELIEGCKGEQVEPGRAARKGNLAYLNPYHTHHVFVDASREYSAGVAAWGHEIPLRAKLERVYATTKGIPVVLLVVQGGPNTLDMMLASAELGCPLLLLSDSGGAATAVWQFCESGIAAVEDAAFVRQEAKLTKLQALDSQRGSTLLSFFRLADEDSQDNMSTALLRALFRNLMHYQTGEVLRTAPATRSATIGGHSGTVSSKKGGLSLASAFGKRAVHPVITGARLMGAAEEVMKRRQDHMQRALLLTVKWNQPEFARRILEELPAGSSDDYSRPMQRMLQHALELQRVEIVSLLLDRPGCSLSSINLCQLYLQEDPYNYLRSDQLLQTRLQRHLSDIAREGSTPLAIFALYKKVVGPSLKAVSPLLYAAVDGSNEATHVDLFFWAIFMGNVPLARELWGHVDNPLHCALLASHVLKTMCRTIKWGRAEVKASSLELEGWAVHVMELVREQELAHFILSQNVPTWRMGALVDLALQMELKDFLAHRHCQSLMDLWWRGGYPGSSCTLSNDDSVLAVVAWGLLPFLNPFLTGQGDSEQRVATWRHRAEREDILLGALARALTLSSSCRHDAEGSENAPAGPSGPKDSPPKRQRAGGRGADTRASAVEEETTRGWGQTPRLSAGRRADHQGAVMVRSQSRALVGREATMPDMNGAHGRRSLLNTIEKVGAGAPPTRGFYSVPYVKFLLRALFHWGFIALYIVVLTHLLTADQVKEMSPHLPRLTYAEMVFIVWAIALGLDHRQRRLRMRAFGLAANLPFKELVQAAHTILVAAIALRFVTLVPIRHVPLAVAVRHFCYTAYQTLVSIDAVLVCIELFTFMWTSHNFGVLTIIMVQMFVDLGLFLVFFVVILLGFSCALIGLSETAEHDGAALGARLLQEGEGGAAELPLFALPLWAMYGDVGIDLERLSTIPFGLSAMWAYVLLANVVLVNLLIAMFADTYSRIKKNAHVEYHYQRFLHIFEYNHVVHAMPPPFNLPNVLWDLATVGFAGAVRAEDTMEALHQVARARPSRKNGVGGVGAGLGTKIPLSKKYVQRYLETDVASALTPAALVGRVETLVSGMEERMGQQLERIDNAVSAQPAGGGGSDASLLKALGARLDRLTHPGGGGGAAEGEGGAASRHAGFWSVMGGEKEKGER